MGFDWTYHPPNEDQHNILKHRGVIGSVFACPEFSYKEYVQPVAKQYKDNGGNGHNGSNGQNGNKKEVKSADQLKTFKHTLSEPFETNYVYVISSDFNAQKARAAALHIFINAVRKHMKSHELGQQSPIWHYVIGGFKDNLRDNETYKQRVGRPGMMVIDGLAENSTEPKIEKARDLAEIYSDIPRIIVTCGVNPLEFAHSRIYLPVNRVLYFGTARKVNI